VTPSWKAAGLALVAALTATLAGFAADVVCPLWALVAFASIASLRELSGFAAIRWMAFVGLISYSLYIWHYLLIEMTGPTFQWVRHKLHSPPLIALSFIALCLGLCWASYVAIEKPGQALVRSLLLRRRAEAAVA
jgi:exopolysaccharide production protein ExoZ